MRKKILLLETGLFGGGSFEGLFRHVESLAGSDAIEFHVVLFVRNAYAERLQNLKNVKVYLIEDPILSLNRSLLDQLYYAINAIWAKGIINIGYQSLSRWIHARAIRAIRAIVQENSIEIIHTNTDVIRDRPGILAAVNEKIRLLIHLRSVYEGKRISINKNYIQYVNRHADLFFSVSEETKSYWESVGLQPEKIIVTHDVLPDFDDIMPADLQQITGNDNLNFICVANFIPVKGHEFLFDALFNIPPQDFRDINIILVGHGSTQELWKQKVQEANAGNIFFMGYRTDALSLMKSADVVLLTSQSEGLPRVIMEGMAMGKVVLATRVGGVPGLVKDGYSGILCSYGDRKALIGSMLELKKNEMLRKRLGANAKETIEKKFSKRAYVQLFQEIYLGSSGTIHK